MQRSSAPAYQVRRPPLQTSVGSGTASRSTTPLVRPNVTLDEWESRAPLSDEAIQSVVSVKERLAERPMPPKFQASHFSANAEAGPSRPSTPITAKPRQVAALLQSPSRSPSRSQTPTLASSPALGSASRLTPFDPLHPTSITTPQQFHDHFTALTLSTEHEQDSMYRDHLAEIVGLRDRCELLEKLLASGEEEVRDMLNCLEYVEERSESLRGACEDLLEEQTHLLTHTSHLAHRLTFFTFLERAQKMLNSPNRDLVLNSDFLPMVRRLDECLSYLGDHRDFKDAELYLIRYQQCMTRSMTLIKIHFVNAIKALGQEISKRIGDKSLSETALSALLYTKFVSLSNNVRPIVAELENRVTAGSDDLAALLAECHSTFVVTRQSLVAGRVAMEVSRLDPVASDLVALTGAGCSYLKQVCTDEFNLYKTFFSSGESPLYGFLESLCDHLYDHIRPRILHEPSLEVLRGVCTVLQALMITDHSADQGDEDEVLSPNGSSPAFSPYDETRADYFSSTPNGRHQGNDSMLTARRSSAKRQDSYAYSGSILTSTSKRRPSRRPLNRLHLEVLLKMVLQDAQTRLVFRSQALLRADVEYYAPNDKDLDYPERLLSGALGKKLVPRQMAVSLDEEDDDEPAFLSLPPPSTQELWYPSLRVTLWILSCLYSYIDEAVFDDVAQEAVLLCRHSLTTASDILSTKKAKLMDSRLFLVRHLLILKEMTGGLSLGQRDRARQWQGITDFLRSLFDNASTILGYARGSLVRSGEAAPDAKADIDRELKRACEDLIHQCTGLAAAPVRQYMEKCTAFLSTRVGSSGPGLSAQTYSTPEMVKETHSAFKSSAGSELQKWKVALMLYLQDEETVKVLIPPAINSIVDVYRHFHDLVRAEYDFPTASSIMTPSAVHNLLLEASAAKPQMSPAIDGASGAAA